MPVAVPRTPGMLLIVAVSRLSILASPNMLAFASIMPLSHVSSESGVTPGASMTETFNAVGRPPNMADIRSVT